MTGQRRKQAQMGEHSRMNRTEFMRQLESLLQNISATEREEALQYYNEYFNAVSYTHLTLPTKLEV